MPLGEPQERVLMDSYSPRSPNARDRGHPGLKPYEVLWLE